jgi:hypothetical protein
MKTFLLISFLALIQLNYQSTLDYYPKLKGIYCSFSSASWFVYHFIDDSTFEFKTDGHFGKTLTRGSYFLDCDTIWLNPFPKDKQSDAHYFKTLGALVITKDSCLISLNNELHCRITPDCWCHSGFKD